MDNKRIKSYITETRIGLFYDKAFSNEEDILNIKSLLSKDFEFKGNRVNKEIKIKPKENNIQEFFDGYTFESSNNKQKVFFERERLLFVDNSQYTSFDNLMKLYDKVLFILNDPFFKNINFKNMLMTTHNEIECPVTKAQNIAPFLPYLNLRTENTNDNNFAFMVGHNVSSFLVKNPETHQELQANIISRIPKLKKEVFPLILDISIGTVLNGINIEYIKSRLQDIRYFRNEIFFSNIGDELKYE